MLNDEDSGQEDLAMLRLMRSAPHGHSYVIDPTFPSTTTSSESTSPSASDSDRACRERRFEIGGE